MLPYQLRPPLYGGTLKQLKKNNELENEKRRKKSQQHEQHEQEDDDGQQQNDTIVSDKVSDRHMQQTMEGCDLTKDHCFLPNENNNYHNHHPNELSYGHDWLDEDIYYNNNNNKNNNSNNNQLTASTNYDPYHSGGPVQFAIIQDFVSLQTEFIQQVKEQNLKPQQQQLPKQIHTKCGMIFHTIFKELFQKYHMALLHRSNTISNSSLYTRFVKKTNSNKKKKQKKKQRTTTNKKKKKKLSLNDNEDEEEIENENHDEDDINNSDDDSDSSCTSGSCNDDDDDNVDITATPRTGRKNDLNSKKYTKSKETPSKVPKQTTTTKMTKQLKRLCHLQPTNRLHVPSYIQMIYSSCLFLLKKVILYEQQIQKQKQQQKISSSAPSSELLCYKITERHAFPIFCLYTLYETYPIVVQQPPPQSPTTTTNHIDSLSLLPMGLVHRENPKLLYRRCSDSKTNGSYVSMVPRYSICSVSENGITKTKLIPNPTPPSIRIDIEHYHYLVQLQERATYTIQQCQYDSMKMNMNMNLDTNQQQQTNRNTKWKCYCGIATDLLHILNRMMLSLKQPNHPTSSSPPIPPKPPPLPPYRLQYFELCSYTGPCSLEGLAGHADYRSSYFGNHHPTNNNKNNASRIDESTTLKKNSTTTTSPPPPGTTPATTSSPPPPTTTTTRIATSIRVNGDNDKVDNKADTTGQEENHNMEQLLKNMDQYMKCLDRIRLPIPGTITATTTTTGGNGNTNTRGTVKQIRTTIEKRVMDQVTPIFPKKYNQNELFVPSSNDSNNASTNTIQQQHQQHSKKSNLLLSKYTDYVDDMNDPINQLKIMTDHYCHQRGNHKHDNRNGNNSISFHKSTIADDKVWIQTLRNRQEQQQKEKILHQYNISQQTTKQKKGIHHIRRNRVSFGMNQTRIIHPFDPSVAFSVGDDSNSNSKNNKSHLRHNEMDSNSHSEAVDDNETIPALSYELILPDTLSNHQMYHIEEVVRTILQRNPDRLLLQNVATNGKTQQVHDKTEQITTTNNTHNIKDPSNLDVINKTIRIKNSMDDDNDTLMGGVSVLGGQVGDDEHSTATANMDPDESVVTRDSRFTQEGTLSTATGIGQNALRELLQQVKVGTKRDSSQLDIMDTATVRTSTTLDSQAGTTQSGVGREALRLLLSQAGQKRKLPDNSKKVKMNIRTTTFTPDTDSKIGTNTSNDIGQKALQTLLNHAQKPNFIVATKNTEKYERKQNNQSDVSYSRNNTGDYFLGMANDFDDDKNDDDGIAVTRKSKYKKRKKNVSTNDDDEEESQLSDLSSDNDDMISVAASRIGQTALQHLLSISCREGSRRRTHHRDTIHKKKNPTSKTTIKTPQSDEYRKEDTATTKRSTRSNVKVSKQVDENEKRNLPSKSSKISKNRVVVKQASSRPRSRRKQVDTDSSSSDSNETISQMVKKRIARREGSSSYDKKHTDKRSELDTATRKSKSKRHETKTKEQEENMYDDYHSSEVDSTEVFEDELSLDTSTSSILSEASNQGRNALAVLLSEAIGGKNIHKS